MLRDQVSAVTSVSTGSIAWLAPINEVLTAVSLLVSILAGLIVIVPWIKRKIK